MTQREPHLRRVTLETGVAAASNFQIKLEGTTAIIDRLLLAGRQRPWKATGPSGDTGTGTDTGTGLPGGFDI